jgi:hypothetical protein
MANGEFLSSIWLYFHTAFPFSIPVTNRGHGHGVQASFPWSSRLCHGGCAEMGHGR